MARGRSQKGQTKMRQKGATNDFANVTSNTSKRCHVHNLANMDSFSHMLQTKGFRSHLNIGDQVILLGLFTYNDDCLNISNDRKKHIVKAQLRARCCDIEF